jgi:hypothetical protein
MSQALQVCDHFFSSIPPPLGACLKFFFADKGLRSEGRLSLRQRSEGAQDGSRFSAKLQRLSEIEELA